MAEAGAGDPSHGRATLAGADPGEPDDLESLPGIDAATAAAMNKLGIFHARQLAELTPEQLAHLDAQLAARGHGPVAAAAGQAAAVRAKAARAAKLAGDLAPPGRRPAAMAAAAGGKGDNLKLIKGIGPKNEAVLHGLGIWHFSQIAGWDDDEQTWTGNHMSFPGRVQRETWVDQAKLLAAGIETDHAAAVRSGALVIDDSADAPLDEVAIARMQASLPKTPVAAAPDHADAAHRFDALSGADFGQPDDLAALPGIDPGAEAALNKLGIFHARQIAELTPEQRVQLNAQLAAGGHRQVGAEAVGAAEAAAKGRAKQAAAAKSAAAPRAAAAPAVPPLPGRRPAAMAAAEGGRSDDLKLIKGIGPGNEAILNGLGIRHFGQIAGWGDDEQTWTGHHMAFPGRVQREKWADQAKLLAAGIETDHAAAVRSGALKIDQSADAPLDEAAIAQMQASLPRVAAAVEGEDRHSGKRPVGLAAARGGRADDLKRIRGIGPQNEMRLHSLGIFHFDQIAAWTREQVQWTGSYLAFPGRIDREDWIAQATQLAQGKQTAFSKRVEAGAVPTSKSTSSLI